LRLESKGCPQLVVDTLEDVDDGALLSPTPPASPSAHYTSHRETMAPKHLLIPEENMAKRLKSSEPEPVSRSITPAEEPDKIHFEIQYPRMDSDALADDAEFVPSPFEAAGALRKGELDQYVRVVPSADWKKMRKYNNCKSKPGACVFECATLLMQYTVLEETYTNDQFVYVRGVNTPILTEGALGNDKDFWVARILQIRASNPKHVYALVCIITPRFDNGELTEAGYLDVLERGATKTQDKGFRCCKTNSIWTTKIPRQPRANCFKLS
jgi:hypothetical protein